MVVPVQQIPSCVVLAYERRLRVRHVVEYLDYFRIVQIPEFVMKAGREFFEIGDFP